MYTARVENNVVDSVGVLEGLTVNNDGDSVDDEGEREGVFVSSCDDDCVGSLEG
jgi:hypothetical protein